MSNETKVIANYLPQYHENEYNNLWWGKGYTDWEAAKKAKPLFNWQVQPRVPLNEYYYDLSKSDDIRWQARLAKESGIYGFGIYHYWFSSDLQLLEKPAEIILNEKDIDINFMFIWDNGSWKRTWSNIKYANDWAPSFDSENQYQETNSSASGVLAELVYGNENEWKKHFEYLLPFFEDKRYIKSGNRPLFGFMQPFNNDEVLRKMCEYWDTLAKKCGFNGVQFIANTDCRGRYMEYGFTYEPLNAKNIIDLYKARLWRRITKYVKFPQVFNYDRYWKRVIRFAKKNTDPKLYHGAFVDFDDTPRRGKKARIAKGATPAKFGKYFKLLLDISKMQNKEFIFITAWNEWGEGAYLEPDQKNKTAYLDALKEVNKD